MSIKRGLTVRVSKSTKKLANFLFPKEEVTTQKWGKWIIIIKSDGNIISCFHKAYFVNAVVQSSFHMHLSYCHLFVSCRSWLTVTDKSKLVMKATFSWMYSV